MLVVGSLTVTAGAAPPSASGALPPSGKVTYPTVAGAAAHRAGLSPAQAGAPLKYNGGNHGIGVTTGAPKVYVVFWGSQWGAASPAGSQNFANDTAGMANRVVDVLKGIGTNGEAWSNVHSQYCEGVAVGATSCSPSDPHVGYPTGGAFAGVWNDTASPAPSSATDHDIAAEAVAAAAHFGNTTAASNRSAQYVIVSAKGTHPGGFNNPLQWCAWHDWNGDTDLVGGPVASAYGDIAFTNLPYLPDAGSSCGANYVHAGAAGALDGVSIVEGHEYAETITDQNPAGGWIDSSGNENADKCAWVGTGGTSGAQDVAFANGSFPMQATWSNLTGSCQIALVDPHSLSGTVKDAAGNPINGAVVTVSGQAPVATDVNGTWSLPGGLVNGSYTVTTRAVCRAAVSTPLTQSGTTTLNIVVGGFSGGCIVDTAAWDTTSTALSLSGDDASVAVPLPFAYKHYGTSYSTAYVSTNGAVNFLAADTSYVHTPIPTAAAPNGAIYPFWSDLQVDASASVLANTFGTAPNRRFVIEWRDVYAIDDPAERFSFQVVLYEDPTQRVRIQYKGIAPGTLATGSDATVGIENATGTTATQVSFDQGVLYDGLSVRPK